MGVLATGTHKFESRYHATLVGPWPAKADRYRKRSPLASSHRINVPVLLFHGAADTVVPVDQTERMFEALRSQGVDAEYRRFEREAHGFRDSATIRETLERGLAFYLRVLAIDAREP